LAFGSFAQERPPATLREILAQRWARIDAVRRPRTELDDRMRIDVFTGDFAQAFADLAAAETVLANEPSELEHAYPAGIVLDGYREAGQEREGIRFAQSYMERRGAWFPLPTTGSEPDAYDLVPKMLAMLRRGGAIDAATFEKRRAQWLERFQNYERPVAWIRGFAASAETLAEARDALERLPPRAELKPAAHYDGSDAAIGHAYLLTGRAADALPFLRSSMRGCDEYQSGILRTRARDWLGQALEATGDAAGACDQYRIVLGRWGQAKPRSVTAEHAKARLAALKCP
jgi:serine/threonine-protein kinase